MEVNTVVQADALDYLRGIADEMVDCVVTSPPYNLKNSTGNGNKYFSKGARWNKAVTNWYDNHADNMPHDEYVSWQRAIVTEALRIIKPAGAIFYNHKWRVQDGLLQNLAGEILDGMPIRQIIIWNRGSGMNFNSGYFIPTCEQIYLIARPDFRLQPKANVYGDVWSITPERDSIHPAPFPIEIPTRCIQSATPLNGLIVDPFAGSGTTIRAAQLLGRHYAGCDISAEYVALANKRLSEPFTPDMFQDAATTEPDAVTLDMFSNEVQA